LGGAGEVEEGSEYPKRRRSFLGVRQSAMQVWPAARDRRSAERPQPPVAPRKRITFLLASDIVLCV
jgi:hypothetical protein